MVHEALTVEDVPPELIIRIFWETLEFPLGIHNLHSFRALRDVCSRWRSIAFSSRRLWSALSVNIRHPSNDAQLAERIKRWFARAGPKLPLRLVVEDVGLVRCPVTYEANQHALMELIHEYHHRWEHLTIALRTNALDLIFPSDIASQPHDKSWSKITTLDLFQRPTPKSLPPPTDLHFLSYAPNLQKLSLRLPQTPTSIPICPQILSLDICIPEPFELELPQLFPCLQELHVEPLLWDFAIPSTELTFFTLKSLKLETFEQNVFDVLDRLTCPSLRELGLRFGQRRNTNTLTAPELINSMTNFASRSSFAAAFDTLSIIRSPACPAADIAIAALLEASPTLRHIELHRWPFLKPINPALLPALSSLTIRDLRPGSVHEPSWEVAQASLFEFLESRKTVRCGTRYSPALSKIHEVVLHRGRGTFPLASAKRLVDLGVDVTIRPNDSLPYFR